MGPCNGPEDFSLVVDTLFGMGPLQRRRLCREWKPYIDDFVVVTGRWNGGAPQSDDDYEKAAAAAVPVPPAARAAAEALAEAGFELPDGPLAESAPDSDEGGAPARPPALAVTGAQGATG